MNTIGTTSSEPLRILFIGNSQFSVWDVPAMVQDLSAHGTRLTCVGSLRGGAWLQTHLETPETLARLEQGNWHSVVLQDHYLSAETAGHEKFTTAALAFHERIQKLHATTVLYASPNIEVKGKNGFAALHALNLGLARKLGIPLAPAGDACLRAWEKNPLIDFHHPDRAHPNFKAAYVGACTLYAALTGKSPVGLPGRCGKDTVSDDEALLFQTAAWAAYRNAKPEEISAVTIQLKDL